MTHKHQWIIVVSPDDKIIGICATDTVEGKSITMEQILRGDVPEVACQAELSLEEIERRVNKEEGEDAAIS